MKENWQRTITLSQVSPDMDGQEVIVNGWVHHVRDKGSLVFVVLRDETGQVQVTSLKKKNPEVHAVLKKISRESALSIRALVRAFEQAPGGVELSPLEVIILNEAHTPLPFDPFNEEIDTGKDTRFDWRILDLRHPKHAAIFKIRSTLLYSITKTMEELGFVYWNTPKILGAASEGGAEVFHVDYFGKDAYLSMSPQLHKQFLAGNTGLKFFEITPYFRAEKHRTRRHLAEFTGIDGEIPYATEEDVWETLEILITQGIQAIKEKNAKELELLGVDLEVPKTPFKRVTYEEAWKWVNEHLEEGEEELPWGEDLTDAQERRLFEYYKGPFFLYDFPVEVAKFYVMKNPKNPKVARAYDLIYRIELVSGAVREHRYEELVKNLDEKGLDKTQFEDYLNAFKYGCLPHAGFGMGIERLVTALLGLSDIRESVAFPRTIERLSP